MKRCMYCGQENDDANVACTKCGNPLLETPVEEDTDNELEMQEQEEFESSADMNPNVTRAAYSDGEVTYEEEPVAEVDFSMEEDAAGTEPSYEEQPYEEAPYEEEPYGEEAYDDDPYTFTDNADYDAPQQYDDRYDDYEEDFDVPHTMSPLMLKSRKRVKSFLFFLPTLCFSVYFAAQILNILLGSARVNLSTVSNTLELNFGSNTAITLLNTVVSLLDGYNAMAVHAVVLLLMIPELLVFFGLWGMFSRTSRRRVSMSTSGYSLTRAGFILRFIEVCVVLLAVIVVAVSFVVAAAASGSTMSLIIGIILTLIAIIIAVLVIMFFVQLIFSVRAIKRNVKFGEFIGRIPGFVIFCGLILTALTAVSMLPMAPDDYIGLIATGAKAAWLLFITLWAMIYRGTVKEEQ